MKTIETRGMYADFPRSGQAIRATHYCAGCGHGIIHKLMGEALADLAIQDHAMMVNPVGCGVFGYYYWDVGNIGAAHGRASAVATGVNRVRRDACTIAYQGDGDLGAIGFNNAFQAAARGEHMAVFFVNNATYGMTGGQMAPTSLIGQKTLTSPGGRDPANDGYPIKVCEVLNTLQAPVYITRVSVADPARIMQAKRAIRRALEIQRDRKGYAFVEILSPCPTNLGNDALTAAAYCIEQMEAEFPLGCLRDTADTAVARPLGIPARTLDALFGDEAVVADAVPDAAFREVSLKFSGFGGQGILSLGLCVAEAARRAGRFTTWFPSYGPEQRGGSAACSVVIAGRTIGSPLVDHPDVLACMNQPAYERFVATVRPGGLALIDSTVPLTRPQPEGVCVLSVPALDLAQRMGVPRAANTVMMGVLLASGRTALAPEHLLDAVESSFRKKPELAAKNREILDAAVAWYHAQHV